MAKSQNNIDKYKKLLFSGTPEITLSTIEDIRKKGDLIIINLLFDLLATSSNSKIKSAVTSLLADIKDEKAAPIFIKAVTERKYKTIQASILQIMWQANINFSKYADTIISIIKNEDFETVIEASTVLDTMVDDIEPEKKDVYKNALKEAAQKSDSPKKELIEDLIHSFDAPPYSIDINDGLGL